MRILINEDFFQKNKYDERRKSLLEFLKDKSFINKKSKSFLFHGTRVNPNDFRLRNDWDGNSGNIYFNDLPEGYLFLTNNIKEANEYGHYIIPCELKQYDRVIVKTKSNNPSNEFDDDYSGYGNYGMWAKFLNSGKSVLEVQGLDRSTFITEIYNVIPRVDLAKEFYENINL